jgi:hypothetical protein
MASDDADDDRPPAEDFRGQYLCEICEEAMTDTVLAAVQSPTGDELAICLRCAAQVGPG